MSDIGTANSLRLTRLIKADRQSVWNAWTRPEEMKRWQCPAPDGVDSIEADFRVGGAYTLVMKVEDGIHTAFGTYREIDEPNRLVYTWDWREPDNAMGETLVTVELIERDGGTEVVLVHEGFPAAEAAQAHEEGWQACIGNLSSLFD